MMDAYDARPYSHYPPLSGGSTVYSSTAYPPAYGAPPASGASSARSSPDEGAYLDTGVNGFAYAQQTHPYSTSSQMSYSAQQPQQQQQHPRSHVHAHSYSSGSSRTSSPATRPSPLPRSSQAAASSSTTSAIPMPALVSGTPLSRPLTHKEAELLAHLDRLKFFLATAPSRWADADGGALEGDTLGASKGLQQGTPLMPHPNTHPALNRFLLPSGEYVTCVLWSGLYHITGTDIVRALVFRFEAFGRPVRNMKKFEEGVFSDLRNLKPGTDACLEEPKSPFLDLLFKYQCIRTQKKQKVFYWFSVPHDRLFLDALERDLKREKMGLEPTTAVMGEPALSFTYDPKRTLYEQFSKAQGAQEGEGELETAVRRAEEAMAAEERERIATAPDGSAAPGTPFFKMFSLFEGSPSYKQRRKKGPRGGRSGLARDTTTSEDDGPGRSDSGAADAIDEADGEMSAAAMFDAQVGLGSGGNAQAQAQKQAETQRLVQAQHLAMLTRRAPDTYDAPRRQTSQVPSTNQSLMAPYRTGGPRQSTYPLMPEASSASMAPTTGVRKTKAYVCPLYSCQRLFKRLEHLKRHVRMHTMERPYQCELCQRRFSRADNLTQHVRTHTRDGRTADAAAATRASPSGAAGSDVDEVEGVEQSLYTPGETYDLNACEVEVPDAAQMRFEDDDAASSGGMFGGFPPYGMNDNAAAFAGVVSTSPENSPRLRSNDWTLGAGGYGDYAAPNSTHPSPAFSNASAPTSRYTTAYGSTAASANGVGGAYRMQSEYSPSAAGSANGLFSAPSSAGSVSAPAHKLSFDHGALYPATLGLSPAAAFAQSQIAAGAHAQGQGTSASQAGRRFRSATPTIARGGEHIRRPSTGDQQRGYHPYAAYSGAVASSAHSSPAPYSLSLDAASYSAAAAGGAAALELGGVSAVHSTTHSPAGSVAGGAAGSFQDELGALMGIGEPMGGVGAYETSAGSVSYADSSAGYYSLDGQYAGSTDQTAAAASYAYDLGATGAS